MLSTHTLILCLVIILPFLDGTIQVMTKNQLVQDCNSTPSLENVNAQFLVNEVRKFVDNCIKTKDGIRFRKRYPHLNKMMNSNEMSPVLWLKDPFLLSTPSTTSLPCDPSHTSSCMIQPTQQQQQSQSPFEGMDEKLIKKIILLEFLNQFQPPKDTSIF
ncbi:uncharacterized protein LOC124499154 isoform X1 [Dermatophagoides farinae]|uniref:uncharacterized protein LOC124499154 isoform X1 n=1 Tax=Dermatophagoides farinae TaxID=6954 RepID=UPI003F613F45